MAEFSIQIKTNKKRKLNSNPESKSKVDVTDDDLSTLADDEKLIECIENPKDSEVHPVSFLFRMNEDRFRILVSSWLDIQSITKLDTALTNHTLRPYWLHCLGSMSSMSCWKSIPENKIEEAIMWITEKNSKFSSINLADCPLIANKSIIRIARKCMFLDALDVKYFSDITDAALACLSFGCPLLRMLHIQGSAVTDLGLHCISEGCRDLHEFYFNKCENITDDGLISLSQRCTKLQGIHFIGGKLFSDIGICALTKSCHMLKSISIIKCLNINDATIVGISTSCPLLEELTFAGINNGISDHSLSSLALGCSCLKMFSFLSTDISATGDISSNITDIGITNLVKGCTNLQMLAIYFCQNVSDYGLSMIAQHTKLLFSFILEDNVVITVAGVTNIIQSCRSITILKIANCAKIELEDIQLLKRNHPSISFSYNDSDVILEASTSPVGSSNSSSSSSSTSNNSNDNDNDNNNVILHSYF